MADNYTTAPAWKFDAQSGTLLIGGGSDIGALAAQGEQGPVYPWQDDRAEIRCVVVGDGTQIVGPQAFAWCAALERAGLGPSVRRVADLAFFDCGALKEIHIGANVTEIADTAFAACPSLTNILIDEANPAYRAENGMLLSRDGTVLVCAPSAAGEYVVPDGVQTIGDRAFYYCAGLASITLPASLTRIGFEAFEGCSGLSVLRYAGEASALAKIAVEGGNDALARVRLETVPAPASQPAPEPVPASAPEPVPVVQQPAGLSWNYDETARTLTVSGIGDMARLAVTDSRGNISYPWDSLGRDSVETVVIAQGVTAVSDSAFKRVHPARAELADSVVDIGAFAFYGGRMESISLPAALRHIGHGAFDWCDRLRAAEYRGSAARWPSVVIEMGNDALKNAPLTTKG